MEEAMTTFEEMVRCTKYCFETLDPMIAHRRILMRQKHLGNRKKIQAALTLLEEVRDKSWRRSQDMRRLNMIAKLIAWKACRGLRVV